MYGIVGTTLFIWSVGLALKKALAQKDLFFQVVIIFYSVFGLFEFSLDREDGIVLLFFPLGLVYGRELPYSANLQHSTTSPAALRPSSVFMTGEGRAVRRDIQLAVPPTMKPESSPNRCAA